MKTPNGQHVPISRQVATSEKVTDHLANERTFLAWMRTGLATITFGFVVVSTAANVEEQRWTEEVSTALPSYSPFSVL